MIRRRTLITLGVILAVGCLSALDHAGVFGHHAGDRSRYQGTTATVARAVDGDTIDVDIPDGGRSTTRIRLWGVDCPEIAHAEGEQDAYYGPEAAEFVRSTVVGRRVRLQLDPNHECRDKYGRLLAFVYLADDDRLLNELLIERGLAYADPRFKHVFEYRFSQLEKTVARQKVGLWAGVTPDRLPPWRQRDQGGGSRYQY